MILRRKWDEFYTNSQGNEAFPSTSFHLFCEPTTFSPMFFFATMFVHVMSGREMRADIAAFKAENRGEVSLEVFLQWRTESENLSGWADMSDVEGWPWDFFTRFEALGGWFLGKKHGWNMGENKLGSWWRNDILYAICLMTSGKYTTTCFWCEMYETRT